MTKKDYKAIAFVIRCAITADPLNNDALVHVIHDLAEYMRLDNPRFDREKFVEACHE